MNLRDIPMEELELMSYTDMTYRLLKEENHPMTTPEIFKMIASLLDYNDTQYAEKIGDYYTSLTIDKRFVLLEDNRWDIRDRHSVSLVLDDEDTEEIEDEIEDDEVLEEIENIDEDLDEVASADLEDLAIIEDDEEEE